MRRIIAAAASVLIASPACANDKLTVMLDWFVNPDHGPIIIAQQEGYFKDENLDVEVIAPADPTAPAKAAASGQVDLAVSYQTQLSLDVDAGLPLVRVGTLIATPLDCLMVRKDGPIQKIADLKGKKVGFSVAGVDEAVLTGMLKFNGLKLSDVNLVNVNFSLSPSLLSGQVDAVIGAFRNFELNQMELAGSEGRCFYPEENGIPSFDALIYVANSESMNKEKIGRFLHATERAVEFIINHPDDSFDVFSATRKELQDELNRRAWADTLPRLARRPAAVDAGRYRRLESFMAQSDLIESEKPASQLAIDVTAE